MRKGLILTGVLYWLALGLPVAADTDAKLPGDVGTGSRAVYVHLIDLLDEQGLKILPDDELLLPFSTHQTCGICHNYDEINGGWHFNAAEPNVAPGRVGEPWILVDAGTGTQIPLSHRRWPGTFRPEQVGITRRQFVRRFGRHMPGGGIGEMVGESDEPEEALRAFVTGKLEINCLACHSAHAGQDQIEYAVQAARQNFRWAATAACEFASVSGSTEKLSNTYDYRMPGVLDDPELVPPTVTYRENIFDHKNRVLFDIVRKVSDERCYFCHSNVDLDKNSSEKWATDEDVHVAAGLTCVDCHRHGLDHNITRGYEGEESVSINPLAAASSCQGCHTSGLLGALVPVHPGIPQIHFDKLTCTACHSGLWPGQKTYRTKTSLAHGLGTYNVNESDDALPHIITPVFARQPGGKIAPYKLFWPAFWGTVKDQKVTPIDLETARRTAGKIIAKERLPRSGDRPALTTEQIAEALTSLQKTIEGRPVYICGGKLYRLDGSAQLCEEDNHPAAKPYLWPIAHSVRPAAQSLGVRACEDCHSTDEAFFFGEVDIDSPLIFKRDSVKRMVEFQDVDPLYMKVFAMSFMFRPWLKVVTLGSCAVLAAVLLLYALKALTCIVKVLAEED